MTRNIEFSVGEFYHLYNRGTDKRKIFLNKRDYERFISLLYLGNSSEIIHLSLQGKNFEELLSLERPQTIVDIGAYCLMPNHFHILVRENVANGISKFMQKITTAYTMYFNKKNERSGALFQGVFKARHVTTDEYLKYLFAYIHLNPIKLIEPEWKEAGVRNKSKAAAYLKTFPYSSYLDLSGLKKRKEKNIIDLANFPNYFLEHNSFPELIDFWLGFQTSELEPSRRNLDIKVSP